MLTKYCPQNASILAMVQSGILSGHVDFQRNFEMTAYDPNYNDSHTRMFTSRYSGLPIVATSPTGSPTGNADPYVTMNLTYGTTGVPKMEYCTAAKSIIEGYVCDVNAAKRAVYSADSFSSWYEDNRMFNRRIGYQQKLTLDTSTKQYTYDSSVETGNFFNPFTLSNQLNKGWPLSNAETTTKKFWFTVEIHTSFQYNGTEVFSFSGDDDVHVYINQILVIDLGGVHDRRAAKITLANFATKLGLVKGQVYQFDMFHVERQTSESNFALTTTLAATCNVITSDARTNGTDVENAIAWTNTGATTNADWEVIAGPGYGKFAASGKSISLMVPNVPNAVGYMFYKPNQVNVGSGFSFKFEFQMTGSGGGHGFAVLFHNRQLGLKDFNGGTGPNLGIKNNDNSFAVVLDVTNPNRQELGVHYNIQGDRRNNMSNATRTVYDPDVIQNVVDGTWHTIEVVYYLNPDWLEVYMDDSLRLRERNFSMINVIGGRNAYIGFSASSSEEKYSMTTQLRNVVMKTVKVLPKNSLSQVILPEGGLSLMADGRANASFQFSTRDACLNTVQYGGLGGLVQSRMVGYVPATAAPTKAPTVSNTTTRRRQLQSLGNTTITINGTNNDLRNGNYQVNFTTTVSTTFSVYIGFGSNCTWDGTKYVADTNCWTLVYPNAVTSVPFITMAPTAPLPDAPLEEVDTSSIVAVGVSVGIVSCCGLIFIIFGVRIRNRWRKDRAFIEKGRLAVLDRGMAFEGDNDLDTLQTKLQQTLHEVQAERAKNYDGQEEAIQRLLQQRGELQEMVRRLKCKRDGVDPDLNPPPYGNGFVVRARQSIARTNRRSMFSKSVVDDALVPPPPPASDGFMSRMRQSVRRPFGGGATATPTTTAAATTGGIGEIDFGAQSSSNPLFTNLKNQSMGKGARPKAVPEDI
ncbi:hypothetical protein BASA81_012567 [Batrachochytrium salamandrivorans]|nr:hypothetical protein BASA81_012567 [Batrachochytrium salamandrivorans]